MTARESPHARPPGRPRPVPAARVPGLELCGTARIGLEHPCRIEAVVHRRLESAVAHRLQPVEVLGGQERDPRTGHEMRMVV